MGNKTHFKIAKIKGTSLGFEDHGCFTGFLHVDYGGSAQGIGGYRLDAPGGKGSAGGMEWIIRAMQACGVDTWEKVAGKTILVYFDSEPSISARPIGIGPLPNEIGRDFFFDEISW